LHIETSRLVLRDFQEKDLDSYASILSAPEMQHFCSPEDTSAERSASLLNMFIADARVDSRLKYQLAITLQDGTLIGSCGVRLESVGDKDASFGCELGHLHWRKGYAIEASHAIVHFGFSELKMHRIYAETLILNTRAVALAEKLGMTVESTSKEHRFVNGEWLDLAVLAILEPEWRRVRL